jgi:preprotein translocase subunit SecB
MRALLQLDNYWVEHIEVKATTEAVERLSSHDAVLPRVSCDVFQSLEDAAYKVDLRLLVSPRLAARGLPYELRLHLCGVFSFEPDTPQEKQEYIIHMSGPAMLYGIARGIIAQATALGPHGKYTLPSINFIELMEREAKKAKKANKTPNSGTHA